MTFIILLNSLCGCEGNTKKSEDDFPSTEQIWGMLGAILGTIMCWVIYCKGFYKSNCKECSVQSINQSFMKDCD